MQHHLKEPAADLRGLREQLETAHTQHVTGVEDCKASNSMRLCTDDGTQSRSSSISQDEHAFTSTKDVLMQRTNSAPRYVKAVQPVSATSRSPTDSEEVIGSGHGSVTRPIQISSDTENQRYVPPHQHHTRTVLTNQREENVQLRQQLLDEKDNRIHDIKEDRAKTERNYDQILRELQECMRDYRLQQREDREQNKALIQNYMFIAFAFNLIIVAAAVILYGFELKKNAFPH